MIWGIDAGAKAAKSTVRATRKALANRIDAGHSQVAGVVDGSRDRANRSLKAAEGAVLGVLDALAERSRDAVRNAESRVYDLETRLIPQRPRRPAYGTALVGIGAGLLLSALLAPSRKTTPADAPGKVGA